MTGEICSQTSVRPRPGTSENRLKAPRKSLPMEPQPMPPMGTPEILIFVTTIIGNAPPHHRQDQRDVLEARDERDAALELENVYRHGSHIPMPSSSLLGSSVSAAGGVICNGRKDDGEMRAIGGRGGETTERKHRKEWNVQSYVWAFVDPEAYKIELVFASLINDQGA
uniref:Uncharacterized protein n=1 Tax=Pristionchus pacificus TaxID=54126 RepID=A0A2A6C9A4_PRIPA|eukprot:PDM74658.1 hypothetical protein PRIPAC_42014 [Pristionchus pacificus]